MSTLRAVEEVHGLLLLRVGRGHIGVLGQDLGVWNAGLLAEAAHTSAVPETDEKRAGSRAKHVAMPLSVSDCDRCQLFRMVLPLTRTPLAEPNREVR